MIIIIKLILAILLYPVCESDPLYWDIWRGSWRDWRETGWSYTLTLISDYDFICAHPAFSLLNQLVLIVCLTLHASSNLLILQPNFGFICDPIWYLPSLSSIESWQYSDLKNNIGTTWSWSYKSWDFCLLQKSDELLWFRKRWEETCVL